MNMLMGRGVALAKLLVVVSYHHQFDISYLAAAVEG